MQARLRSDRAITAALSDTVNLPDGPAIGIYVGGQGDVKADCGMSASVTFVAVPAGTTIMTGFKRIWSTGTDATNIIALY